MSTPQLRQLPVVYSISTTRRRRLVDSVSTAGNKKRRHEIATANSSNSANNMMADVTSGLEKLKESSIEPQEKKVVSQIALKQTKMNLPQRRLSRVSEHLVKVPFVFLKEFFCVKGLVTEKVLQRIEVVCFTNEEKVTRLIVTQAIPSLKSDIVPDLIKHLEKDYKEITSVIKEESLLCDHMDFNRLSTLNLTFALLTGIDKLENLMQSLNENSLEYLKEYVKEKRKFYWNWIQLVSQFGTTVKIFSVSINKSLLTQFGLSSKAENELDSLEEKVILFSKLIQETRKLIKDCQEISKNFKFIKEEANKHEGVMNSILLERIIDSGPDEFQWMIYIYDCLKLECLQIETKRAEKANVEDNHDSNFEYLDSVSHYWTWSATVKHFVDSFIKDSFNIECNSYGLAPWNRNFLGLKESFLRLNFKLIGPQLVTTKAIDVLFHRALCAIIDGPLEGGNNNATASHEKTSSNHSDVMHILLQNVSTSKNHVDNKATMTALMRLKDKKLNEKTENLMSQSALASLHVSKGRHPQGLSDPDTAISSVNEHLEGCVDEAFSEFGTARVNSILRWVNSTPQLGTKMDRCRELGKKIYSKIEPFWKLFIDEGGLVKTGTEATIENYGSLCKEVIESYNYILLKLEGLRDERQGQGGSKVNGDEPSLVQFLEKAEESVLKKNHAVTTNWLKKQKLEIEEEALELQEVIEMVRVEMFCFEVELIKAKHCCTIVDTVSELRNSHGSVGVRGHESKIAARLEKTSVGKDSKKFARILGLESEPDLLAGFHSSDSTAYARTYKCLQIWIDRNGAKTTTMDNLSERLRKWNEELCAQIVEKYQETVVKNSGN